MSKGGAKFFALEKFPNAMKHRIVGNYVKSALPTLINWSNRDVWYADLFAGAGRYDDGQPGSPLIVAEEADQRFRTKGPPLIHCFNVERDPGIFDALQKNTSHIAPEVIDNRLGDWSNHLDDLLALTQPNHAPLIVFLDPFGFEGIELSKLVQILSGIGSEAREMVITLNLAGMQRMVAAEHAARLKGKAHDYSALPDRVFGTPTWRASLVDGLLPDESLQRLVDLYEQQLFATGGGGFQRAVASIGVPTRMGGPDAYFLVFVTRSSVGLMKMNESANLAFERAWMAEEKLYLVPEFGTGLPRYADRTAALRPVLAAEVLTYLATQPFGTHIENVYVDLAMRHFGRFRMTHLGGIVRSLRTDGTIVTNPKALERDTFIALATSEGGRHFAKPA
ncbi:MAG: three-Cys-motif partner protein TcmP [Actinomycetota bacterium]|nr:three-Cys-motif partner protein TcmP [Actinomycetota bacterium]